MNDEMILKFREKLQKTFESNEGNNNDIQQEKENIVQESNFNNEFNKRDENPNENTRGRPTVFNLKNKFDRKKFKDILNDAENNEKESNMKENIYKDPSNINIVLEENKINEEKKIETTNFSNITDQNLQQDFQDQARITCYSDVSKFDQRISNKLNQKIRKIVKKDNNEESNEKKLDGDEQESIKAFNYNQEKIPEGRRSVNISQLEKYRKSNNPNPIIETERTFSVRERIESLKKIRESRSNERAASPLISEIKEKSNEERKSVHDLIKINEERLKGSTSKEKFKENKVIDDDLRRSISEKFTKNINEIKAFLRSLKDENELKKFDKELLEKIQEEDFLKVKELIDYYEKQAEMEKASKRVQKKARNTSIGMVRKNSSNYSPIKEEKEEEVNSLNNSTNIIKLGCDISCGSIQSAISKNEEINDDNLDNNANVHSEIIKNNNELQNENDKININENQKEVINILNDGKNDVSNQVDLDPGLITIQKDEHFFENNNLVSIETKEDNKTEFVENEISNFAQIAMLINKTQYMHEEEKTKEIVNKENVIINDDENKDIQEKYKEESREKKEPIYFKEEEEVEIQETIVESNLKDEIANLLSSKFSPFIHKKAEQIVTEIEKKEENHLIIEKTLHKISSSNLLIISSNPQKNEDESLDEEESPEEIALKLKLEYYEKLEQRKRELVQENVNNFQIDPVLKKKKKLSKQNLNNYQFSPIQSETLNFKIDNLNVQFEKVNSSSIDNNDIQVEKKHSLDEKNENMENSNQSPKKNVFIVKDEEKKYTIFNNKDFLTKSNNSEEDKILPASQSKYQKNLINSLDEIYITQYNLDSDLPLNPLFLDILCINCYECVKNDEVDLHSKTCVVNEDEYMNLNQNDEDVNGKIFKLYQNLKKKDREYREFKGGLLYSVFKELLEITYDIFLNNNSIEELDQSISKLQFLIKDNFKSINSELIFTLIINSKRVSQLVYMKLKEIEVELKKEKIEDVKDDLNLSDHFSMKSEKENEDNDQYLSLKNELITLERQTMRSKFELEAWRKEAKNLEKMLKKPNNNAEGLSDIVSDVNSVREGFEEVDQLTNITGQTDNDLDVGNLKDINEVLIAKNEEELKKYFYSLGLNTKFKYVDKIKENFSIEELYQKAKSNHVLINDWQNFILSELKLK